jgi:hypothetical protein
MPTLAELDDFNQAKRIPFFVLPRIPNLDPAAAPIDGGPTPTIPDPRPVDAVITRTITWENPDGSPSKEQLDFQNDYSSAFAGNGNDIFDTEKPVLLEFSYDDETLEGLQKENKVRALRALRTVTGTNVIRVRAATVKFNPIEDFADFRKQYATSSDSPVYTFDFNDKTKEKIHQIALAYHTQEIDENVAKDIIIYWFYLVTKANINTDTRYNWKEIIYKRTHISDINNINGFDKSKSIEEFLLYNNTIEILLNVLVGYGTSYENLQNIMNGSISGKQSDLHYHIADTNSDKADFEKAVKGDFPNQVCFLLNSPQFRSEILDYGKRLVYTFNGKYTAHAYHSGYLGMNSDSCYKAIVELQYVAGIGPTYVIIGYTVLSWGGS